MKYATMRIARGVEVNLARRALQDHLTASAARALIPDEGGFIANLFNNERGRDVEDWIEAIYSAVHENRERHRRAAREVDARAKGEIVCPSCGAQGKPAAATATTQWGNSYREDVCRYCGTRIE